MLCTLGTVMCWNIEDGDLFYVLRRKKKQPQIKDFVSLPGLDYDIGKTTLTKPCNIHQLYRSGNIRS